MLDGSQAALMIGCGMVEYFFLLLSTTCKLITTHLITAAVAKHEQLYSRLPSILIRHHIRKEHENIRKEIYAVVLVVPNGHVTYVHTSKLLL